MATLVQTLFVLLGEYFFELDDKSVVPGYPKLIQDVWGISGPIDAAFTRINCQGKSYIFKVGTSISIESVFIKLEVYSDYSLYGKVKSIIEIFMLENV